MRSGLVYLTLAQRLELLALSMHTLCLHPQQASAVGRPVPTQPPLLVGRCSNTPILGERG